MHEVGLAGSILGLVEAAAARERFRRVARLRLEAGALAGIEPAALRFALESMVRGTCLEGASIEIDQPPGMARCLRCGGEAEVRERGQPCPHCGGWRLEVSGGDALRVVELLVEGGA